MSAQLKEAVAVEIKLDLGCGQNKQPGFTGVDIWPGENVDIAHDLRIAPWPWTDNSVAEVYSSHFIEHLDGDEQMRFMNELHRILKVGGQVTLIAPYANSLRAWQDPTHKRPISEMSFIYYNREWRENNKLTHYPITADFDFNYSFNLNPNVATRSNQWQQFGVMHYNNVANDIVVKLTKKEPKE